MTQVKALKDKLDFFKENCKKINVKEFEAYLDDLEKQLMESGREKAKGDMPEAEFKRRARKLKELLEERAEFKKDMDELAEINKQENYGPRSRELRNFKKEESRQILLPEGE